MDVDSHGTIWIAAIVVPPLQPSAIAVARSNDGGSTFEVLRRFDPPSNAHWLGDATVAIDPHDRVFVGWAQYNYVSLPGSGVDIAGSIKVTRTEDGTTWSEPQTVEPAGRGPQFQDRPWLSIGPDGAAYLTWISSPVGSLRPGENWSRAEGAQPFVAPKPILTQAGHIIVSPLAFDVAGRPVAVGSVGTEIRVWRYEGEAWASAPAASYHSAPGAVNRYAQITSDRAGNLTVVFVNGSDGSVVPSVSRSVDGGRTWSGGMRIDRGFGPSSSAALPWVTTDSRGRVHAMWLDNRSGSWVPYTAMADDGLSFREPERIGDAGFLEDGSNDRWIGDFNALVVKNGRRYAAWTDGRENVSRIYFSTAAEPQ